MRKILGVLVAGALLAGSTFAYGEEPMMVILPNGDQPSEPAIVMNPNPGGSGSTNSNSTGSDNGGAAINSSAASSGAQVEPAAQGQVSVNAAGESDDDQGNDYVVRNSAIPKLAAGEREYLSRSIEVFGAMPLPKKLPRPSQAMHEKDTFQVTKSIVSVGEPRFLNRSKGSGATRVMNGVEPSAPTPSSFKPLESGPSGTRPAGNPPVTIPQ